MAIPSPRFEYFTDAMASFDARPPQVALMKFCYVDFTPSTNPEALFKNYQDAITSLQRKYPTVRFVPVTVPLTTRPSSLKDMVKRFMGLYGAEGRGKRAPRRLQRTRTRGFHRPAAVRSGSH